jgi:hypothetical protein
MWGGKYFETGVMAHRMDCHYERRGEIDNGMYVSYLTLLTATLSYFHMVNISGLL